MIVSSFVQGYFASRDLAQVRQIIWSSDDTAVTFVSGCLEPLVAHDIYLAVDAVCKCMEVVFHSLFTEIQSNPFKKSTWESFAPSSGCTDRMQAAVDRLLPMTGDATKSGKRLRSMLGLALAPSMLAMRHVR